MLELTEQLSVSVFKSYSLLKDALISVFLLVFSDDKSWGWLRPKRELLLLPWVRDALLCPQAVLQPLRRASESSTGAIIRKGCLESTAPRAGSTGTE